MHKYIFEMLFLAARKGFLLNFLNGRLVQGILRYPIPKGDERLFRFGEVSNFPFAKPRKE